MPSRGLVRGLYNEMLFWENFNSLVYHHFLMSDITDCVIAVMIQNVNFIVDKYFILLNRIQHNFHDIPNNTL